MKLSNDSNQEFIFDFDAASRKLKFLRCLNIIFWGGTFVLALLLVNEIVRAAKVQFDQFFIGSLALNILFGIGTFKCNEKMKFIKFQILHFSEMRMEK